MASNRLLYLYYNPTGLGTKIEEPYNTLKLVSDGQHLAQVFEQVLKQ